ncbi:MAG: 3-dehydroquinate synthase [Thermovenabulum sp.]|uniref:3-dehydroquinate synthase n=1 Tax=Thermovenabulum sp. TaxID=3100335 RepID=UPI003C7D3DFF
MVSKNKNIVLSGLPGSGKTTIGKILAENTNRAFVDTDRLIEDFTGETISDIFKRYGEERFREIESFVIQKVSQLKNTVISLGGGTLTRRGNYELLKNNSTIIFLNASLETLLSRLENDFSRPLLESDDLNSKKEKLSRLYDARIKLYQETADIILEADDSPEKIAGEILKILPSRELKIHHLDNENVFVKTPSRNYYVKIGYKLFRKALIDFLQEQKNISKIVIVTSPLLNQLFCAELVDAAKNEGLNMDTVLIQDEETQKNLTTVSKIYDRFVDLNIDRDSLVIAVGGGITGDIAGFAAATYMRGIRWVYVPTTLLAQVDASIGGKVAVNHKAGKNLIGAFYQPNLVISDIGFLDTLPDKIFNDGMAEVIKTAVIDGDLFYFLENNACKIKERDPKVLLYTVTACTRLKSRIVQEDEYDKGMRMLLNLGHTFGHAIEAASGYKGVTHGEAVSIGICLAARLAFRLGYASPGIADRIINLLKFFDLPVSIKEVPESFKVDDILRYLKTDKKGFSGKVRFVLPFKIGDVRVIDNLPDNVTDIVKEILYKEMEENGK